MYYWFALSVITILSASFFLYKNNLVSQKIKNSPLPDEFDRHVQQLTSDTKKLGRDLRQGDVKVETLINLGTSAQATKQGAKSTVIKAVLNTAEGQTQYQDNKTLGHSLSNATTAVTAGTISFLNTGKVRPREQKELVDAASGAHSRLTKMWT